MVIVILLAQWSEFAPVLMRDWLIGLKRIYDLAWQAGMQSWALAIAQLVNDSSGSARGSTPLILVRGR